MTPGHPTPIAAHDQDRDVLHDLRRHLGAEWSAPDLTVTDLQPFGDGHSGFTYTVELAGGPQDGRHVLRLSPAGLAIRGSTDVGRQGRIMAALHGVGAPVPRVLASDSTGTITGRAFALLTLVPGTSWEDHAARFGHDRAASDAITALRAIQRTPVIATGIENEAPVTPVEEVYRWVTLFHRAVADIHGPAVRLRQALEATAARCAAPMDPVLVHGDFHFGNLVYGPQGVRAVLDWEIASLGHPLTDLACLAVAALRGRYDDPNPTGSVRVPVTTLIALYGAEPEPAAWHIAASCFKYAAIIGYNLQLHRRGKRLDPVYESLQQTMHRLIDDGLLLLDGGLERISDLDMEHT